MTGNEFFNFVSNHQQIVFFVCTLQRLLVFVRSGWEGGWITQQYDTVVVRGLSKNSRKCCRSLVVILVGLPQKIRGADYHMLCMLLTKGIVQQKLTTVMT